MKKFLSILVVLALMATGLVISAFAAEDTLIAVEKTEAAAGEEVTVEVVIANNPGFAAASFLVEYDTEAMTLTGIDTTGCLLSGATVNPSKGAVSFAATEDITGDGKLFVLTFQVNEDAADATYAVSVTIRKLIHDDRSAVDATVDAGSITVVHACELVDVAEVPATCTEAGVKAHQKCSICGKLFVDGVEVTEADLVIAAGHTEEVVAGKEATCTEPGLTEGKKCSVCGEILVAQEEIPATGHTEEVLPGKEATCTEPGLTEGKKCSDCGETLVAQEEIPALGHTYVDGVCHCGAKEPAPETGDGIYLAIVAALASMVGIVALTKKKEI
jgi:hypothetical protein